MQTPNSKGLSGWAVGMHRPQHTEIGEIAKRHGVKRVKVVAALLQAWKTMTPTKQAKLISAPLDPMPADRTPRNPARHLKHKSQTPNVNFAP